jgi:predicted metal-dependent hydrolase
VSQAGLSASPGWRQALWWNDGHALRTRLLDALSLMLPSAEQFLIDTTTAWLASGAASAPGHHPVARFMAEERAHQRAHRRYNQRLHEAGLPARSLEQRVEAAVAGLAKLPLTERLAIASALEHLTAVFAREILRDENPWLTAAPTPESRLWRWHGEEELAHSDVVFDLLPGARVARRHKALAVLMAAAYLAHDTLALTRALCAHDVRSGHISRTRLACQAAGLALQATPSLLRMGAGMARVMARALR